MSITKKSSFCDTYSFPFIIDFENWAWYRPGEGKMFPKDIDPSLCTHLMYSFATLDANSLLMKSYDTWADINNSKLMKVELDWTSILNYLFSNVLMENKLDSL